nr:MAG TPA: hypothetical protein [Caudoviricetes sp.]
MVVRAKKRTLVGGYLFSSSKILIKDVLRKGLKL